MTAGHLPSPAHVTYQRKLLHHHLEVPCKICDLNCKAIWIGQRGGWYNLSEGTGSQSNLLGGGLVAAPCICCQLGISAPSF